MTKDAIVTLGDVADIRRTFKDFSSYARVNGEDAVTLEIILREGANAIDASSKINSILKEFQSTLPPNLRVVVTDDDSVYSREMVKELLHHLSRVNRVIICNYNSQIRWKSTLKFF